MQKQFNKKILILIPLTIPSSGKTILFKDLKNDQSFHIEIVSSDVCRQQVMNSIKQKNPQLTHKELFDKSGKPSKTLFEKYIKNAYIKLYNSDKEKCILVLDKNHPLNALPSTIKQLIGIIGKSQNVKIVALVPECSNTFSPQKLSYPFSIQYLITCIIRAINRQSHETLLGSPTQRATIVLSFFNMFRGVKFDFQTLGKNFNYILGLKMFNEQIPDLNQDIRNLVYQILSSIKPGSFTQTPFTPTLVQTLKDVKINEIPIPNLIKQNKAKINILFDNFENLKIN